ncbi:MAG: tRNA (adenosine(37)-N6)-threonylcarbamoyltransferase complex transferase subunit TsaD [Candidatus Zixiibacteriota bacterium]|nr:MAG: tRNA (adenosine(37)-N6)-threonylcarbamoyltransferase complex transferase subunit TsaD [candidate division Zixibacteria bacterium]
MLILGIETSCDETAASVVNGGNEILSNVVYSQMVHDKYGGVVPELASREHIRAVVPVVNQALGQANASLAEIEGVAVTYGPGLVGSLLIGLSYSKAISYSQEIPLIGINHIEGHIFADFLEHPKISPPFVCLVISGGHSNLIYVAGKGDYELMGQTRDDAAGEAFDKVAKVLNLGYPGGPAIDEVSPKGKSDFFKFPRAYLEEGSFDFSFSGLKTAVAIYVSRLSEEELENHRIDVAASFQEAVVDVLVEKGIQACLAKDTSKIALAGGVARNRRLRKRLREEAEKQRLEVFYPSPILCTDNAAMIAAAGDFHLSRGRASNLDLNAVPHASLTAGN